MSRMLLASVSGSLSKTTSWIVTFSGTVKVCPRSWHSSTSYLNFSATGSPQLSHSRTSTAVRLPQASQVACPPWASGATSRWPHDSQVLRRCSIPCSCPHLHSQLPIVNSTNSSEQVCRKSWIGKIDLKTPCRPTLSRSWGRVCICRKRSYERRCTSIRFGIGIAVLIFEKLIRLSAADLRVSLIVASTPTPGSRHTLAQRPRDAGREGN